MNLRKKFCKGLAIIISLSMVPFMSDSYSARWIYAKDSVVSEVMKFNPTSKVNTYSENFVELSEEVKGTSEAVEYSKETEEKFSMPDSISERANQQEKMPSESDTIGNLSVNQFGRRLEISQTNTSAQVTSPNTLSYYLFPESTKAYRMEADIKITAVGSSNNMGMFAGLFSGEEPVSRMVTVGFRGGSSTRNGLRNIYSKSGGNVGAGGLNTAYTVGETIHVVITKTNEGVTTEITTSEETAKATVSYKNMDFLTGINDSARYGFAFANVQAVIRNLKLISEDGISVLYDQNDCYDAIGSAPVVTSVNAATLSADRTELSITWNGTPYEDDGAYMVELSSNGGETYQVLDDYVTAFEYTANINGDGNYRFRISGICGDSSTEKVESNIVPIQAPLDMPVLNTESSDSLIMLNWNVVEGANQYNLYRRSSDEAEYTLITETTDMHYQDTNVINETPYYYYLIAKSDTNESNASKVVMTVPTGGRQGTYVYEDEAADITITKKSYDTVYSDKATLEGYVDRNGSLSLNVNDIEKAQVTLTTDTPFRFQNIQLEEGRNDVDLLFTDSEGKVTRKTYNFVYLTHFDKIVDGNYTGTNGEESTEFPGVTVYRTVQSAVDSVPEGNANRIVILVKEGNYVEHLVISSANISLIGEDREKVNISYFDSVESPVGGDMAKRCAVYVTNKATNFSAENLTVENNYEYIGDGSISNESADALRVDADGSMFINVKMLGYQDTLNASTNRQYYEKCYITGNVDYIYGSAQALFNDCDLVFRYSPIKNSGYVTAPRTDSDKYGYIFYNCRITADKECSGTKYLLGRPWGPDGFAAFIECYMSDIINKTAPYGDMSGNMASDARFQEYYSYGGGYAINSLRPQISKTQAEEMLTVSQLGWDPYTNITEIYTIN